MRKPHKHAAVIKAWADGKAIEYFNEIAKEWKPVHINPIWGEMNAYRVKPEPLEWQAERDAFARGEGIECAQDFSGPWFECKVPAWYARSTGIAYRIKPKPHKWQKEREAFERGERVQIRAVDSSQWEDMRPGEMYFWSESFLQFRIPHKWQAEMDAWERGEAVECRGQYLGSAWTEMSRSGNPHMQPAWMELLEYRIKPKTVKVRIRVAAMGELELGRGWAQMVETEERAETIERSPRFLCWLHDWKEIERPAPEVPKVPPGVYINGKAMSWVGVDYAAGPCQTGWWTVGIDGNGMMTPVRCDGPWKR